MTLLKSATNYQRQTCNLIGILEVKLCFPFTQLKQLSNFFCSCCGFNQLVQGNSRIMCVALQQIQTQTQVTLVTTRLSCLLIVLLIILFQLQFFCLFDHASVIFSRIYRTSKAKLTWVLLKNLCLWIHQFMGQQFCNQNQDQVVHVTLPHPT